MGEPVINITTMTETAEEERRSRMRRYLLMMAIRTVCVMLMVFVRGPWLWVIAAIAIFFPWIAVVLANHVRKLKQQPVQRPTDTPKVVQRPAISAADWLDAADERDRDGHAGEDNEGTSAKEGS